MPKKTINLSKLTEAGYEEFLDFLYRNKTNPSDEEPPYHLLNEAEELIFNDGKTKQIEFQVFNTRKDLGSYIANMFSSIEDLSKIIDDKFAGAFLSLYYFSSICDKKDGKWKLGAIPRYIPYKLTNRTNFYRNHIFSPITMYYLHGELSNIFLCQSPHKHPEIMEAFAGREDIVANPSLIEVANTLYWDEENKKVKTGAQNSKPPIPNGAVRRFVGPGSFTRQHELTHDFWSLTHDEIMELLPSEFFDEDGEIRTSYSSSADE